MIVFGNDEDESVGPRDQVENRLSLSASPALSIATGIFLISISSVSISPRFETSPKTKLAAGSLKRPCRAVPRITGMKTGRVASCIAMLGFVAVT